MQSWAQTIEKVSDNRHTENQQPTPDNQKPTTATDSGTRPSTVNPRQPTSDNRQQTTATDRYTQQTEKKNNRA
jgi:hypothetical protein